jgi:Na+/H+ antiporter NhaD/arsenite permease-like protein
MNESIEEDYQKIQSENKKITIEFRLRLTAVIILMVVILFFEECFK